MSRILQGRYRILKTIGQGGAGAVHLCADLRLEERRWAVKELVCSDPSQLTSALQRFQREASLLAGLRHPNLPVIVDFFVEGDKQYLVREYIEGDTLAERIDKQGPASEGQAVEWALQMCQVLSYLHGQDPPIIYRDLKPQNIVLASAPRADANASGEAPPEELRLIDFGLARPMDRIRRDTAAAGSVGYAAPEQWEDGEVTPRTDLYALGATLYFCLTGRPPSPVAGTHRLTPLRPDLQKATEALILRCMQPIPEERPESAASLERELRACLERAQRIAPALEKPRRVRRVPAGLAGDPATPPWFMPVLMAATAVFVAGLGVGGAWLAAGEKQPLPTPTVAATAGAPEGPRLGDVSALIISGQYSRARQLLAAERGSPAGRVLEANIAALESGRPVNRVPVLVPLTGHEAEAGWWMCAGLSLAQARVNQAAGSGLVLDLFDTESDSKRVLELATQEGERPANLCLFGPYSSQQTLLITPVCNAAKLPLLAPTASDPRVGEAGPWIFDAADTNRARVEAVASYLCSQGRTRGVIVSNDSSYLSRSMTEFFQNQVTRLGGKLEGPLLYRQESLDPGPLVADLKRRKPDFIFIADNRGRIVAQLCQAIRAAGLDCALGTQVLPGSQELLEEGGEAIDGLVCSTVFDSRSQRPEINAFVEEFHRWYGAGEVSQVAALAYDAMLVLADALRQCRSRDELRTYLDSFGTSRPLLEGITGKYALDTPRNLRKVTLLQIRGGRYYPL